MVYDTTLYFNLFLFDVKKNHESKKHYAQILCHCQLSFPQVQVCHIHLVFSWLRLCMFKWIHAKVPHFMWYLQQAGYLWGYSPGRSALLGCQQG